MAKKVVKSENLFQAYRRALAEEQQAQTPEEKIEVFSRVTDFCRKITACNSVSEEVRNIVLFWSYAKLGDIAYNISPNDERTAIFYKNALHFAPGNTERIAIGKKLAAFYMRAGDNENLQEILKMLLRYREDANEIENFIQKAKEEKDTAQRRRYLQEAWQTADCDNGAEARSCREIFDMLSSVPKVSSARNRPSEKRE